MSKNSLSKNRSPTKKRKSRDDVAFGRGISHDISEVEKNQSPPILVQWGSSVQKKLVSRIWRRRRGDVVVAISTAAAHVRPTN